MMMEEDSEEGPSEFQCEKIEVLTSENTPISVHSLRRLFFAKREGFPILCLDLEDNQQYAVIESADIRKVFKSPGHIFVNGKQANNWRFFLKDESREPFKALLDRLKALDKNLLLLLSEFSPKKDLPIKTPRASALPVYTIPRVDKANNKENTFPPRPHSSAGKENGATKRPHSIIDGYRPQNTLSPRKQPKMDEDEEIDVVSPVKRSPLKSSADIALENRLKEPPRRKLVTTNLFYKEATKKQPPNQKRAFSPLPYFSFPRFPAGVVSGLWKGSPTKREGFKNLGNTCYINAVLQSLTNLIPLTSDLQDPRLVGCSLKSDTLFRTFLDVIRKKKVGGVVDPRELKDCIAKTASRFSDNNQEDSHEFFGEVLDLLYNELSEHTRDPLKPQESASKNETHKPLCPVSINFQMDIENVVTCQNCKNTLQNRSIHRDLSVDVPLLDFDCELDLAALVRMFFESEVVEHTCEECKHDQAVFSHVIKSLPRVLVVHVKRFRANVDLRTYEKLQAPIDANPTLDLGEYCSKDTSPPTPSPVKKKVAAITEKPLAPKPKPKPKNDDWIDIGFDDEPPRAAQRKLFDVVDIEEDSSTADLSEAEQLKWAMNESSKHESDEEEFKRALELSLLDQQQPERNSVITLDDELPLKPEPKSFAKFTLHSVVSHIGSTAHNGHYVCDVWDEKGKAWKNYNDSLMSELGSHKTMNDKRRRSGYMFFYTSEDGAA